MGQATGVQWEMSMSKILLFLTLAVAAAVPAAGQT